MNASLRTNLIVNAFLLTLLAAFAGCGPAVLVGILSDDDSSSGGSGAGFSVPSASGSTVTVDPKYNIPADGEAVATVTVVVMDGYGKPMEGQVVEISTTGEGNIITQPGAPTDVDGVAVGYLATTKGEARTVIVTVNPGMWNEAVLNTQPTVVFNPVVWGNAKYIDVNKSGACDQFDALIVPFNGVVVVDNATPDDFVLPVSGDALGTGAFVQSNPAKPSEVVIYLGSSPSMKTRHIFDPAKTDPGSPSGVDVSSSMTPGAIRTKYTGVDVLPSKPKDIVPAMVDGGQNLGGNVDDNRTLALGDLNGDGAPDLVEGNYYNANRVLLNDGDGKFPSTSQTFGDPADKTNRLALGDLNGDGWLDIVEGNYALPNNVWLNDGAGNFTSPSPMQDNYGTMGLILADVNRDGKLDLLEKVLSSALFVFFGNGDGTFTDTLQNLKASNLESVKLGDFDGNGWIDVLQGRAGKAPRIYFNTGAGVFGPPTNLPGANKETYSVDVGDLDGDGDLDFVEGNWKEPNAQPSRIWLNDGTGVFTIQEQEIGEAKVEQVSLRDFDGDGDLDLLINTGDEEPHQLWLNDGTGNYLGDKPQEFGKGLTKNAPLADVDRDGDLDFVVMEMMQSTPQNRVWQSSLSGTWGEAVFVDSGMTLDTSMTYSVAAGDLDGDGDLDFVEGNRNALNRVNFFDKAAGAYNSYLEIPDVYTTNAIALGDIDHDGDLDLLEGNYGQSNRVLLNDGSGVFTTSALLPGTNDTNALVLGDVDGDGDLDLVEGNYNQANRLWINNQGNFTEDQTFGDYFTMCLSVGDVDKDGDLDLLEGNYNQANRVWINDQGSFTEGQAFGNYFTMCLSLGDVNKDGYLDLAEGNLGEANRVWVYDKNQNLFLDSGQTMGGEDTAAVALHDLDGDGDLDLVSRNRKPGQNRIWLNNGMGLMQSGQVFGIESARSLALGDIDRDGDVDLIHGNGIEDPCTVWWNEE